MQTIWGQVACIHANGGTPNTTIALNLIVCIKLQHGGGEESSYLVFVWSVNSWIVSDCRHLGGRSSSFQLMYTMVSCLHLNPCEIVCCPSMSYLGKALHSYRTQALRSWYGCTQVNNAHWCTTSPFRASSNSGISSSDFLNVQAWSDCKGGLKQCLTPDCKDTNKDECYSCSASQKQKKHFTSKEIKTFTLQRYLNSKYFFFSLLKIDFSLLQYMSNTGSPPSTTPPSFPLPPPSLEFTPIHFLLRKKQASKRGQPNGQKKKIQ